jgi:hypothetical protein
LSDEELGYFALGGFTINKDGSKVDTSTGMIIKIVKKTPRSTAAGAVEV